MINISLAIISLAFLIISIGEFLLLLWYRNEINKVIARSSVYEKLLDKSELECVELRRKAWEKEVDEAFDEN